MIVPLANFKYTIKDLKEFANKAGFILHPTHYRGIDKKYKVTCRKNNHTLFLLGTSLRLNRECNECLKLRIGKWNKKYTINDVRNTAKQFGFTTISKVYVGPHDKLEFLCAFGHYNTFTHNSLKLGKICKICSKHESLGESICRAYFEYIFRDKFPNQKLSWLRNNKDNMMELDGYNPNLGLAFEYHGRQHFIHEKHFHSELQFKERLESDKLKRFQCKEKGIKLIEIPYSVKFHDIQSYILNQLKRLGVKFREDLEKIDYKKLNIYSIDKLKELRKIFDYFNLFLLSDSYINARTKYRYSCKICRYQGSITADNLKRSNGCPKCLKKEQSKGQMANHLDVFNECLAKGYKLLEVYTGARKKHNFLCLKCKRVFDATPDNIKRGKGCPYCVGKRKTIKDLQKAALQQGGKCLTKEYKGIKACYLWECIDGHQWKAIGESILRGTWCRECYLEKRTKNVEG